MKAKELWTKFKYGYYIMTHPFDGFYDLKHEHRGSLGGAHLHVLLMIIIMICKRQLTAFVFNTNDLLAFNPLAEIGNSFVPFILWCVSNWCFTTLMDGEGTFKDVYMASAYALTPFNIINVLAIIVSYFLTEETGSLYTLLIGIGIVWLGALLFFGLLTTHQYTFGKGLIAGILTVGGIVVMLYLGLLFCKVISNIVTFVSSIIYEFRVRFMG